MVANTWNQPKCPTKKSMDYEVVVNRYNEMLHSCKNDAFMKIATKWMEPEDIILHYIK